jgi:hypothetical protein
MDAWYHSDPGCLAAIRIRWNSVMKLILAVLLSSVFLGPASPIQTSEGEPIAADAMPDIGADGWVDLFNGKNLDGWTQRNGTATYRVEDGVIVGKTAEGSPNSFLCTNAEYADFELTFEVNDDPGLNSGVQIRSLSTSDFKNGRVRGPQVEIENAPGESGYLYSEGTGRGWITKDQPVKDAYQNGRWNRFVMRAYGDRIQTWVNGVPIADIRDKESGQRGFIGLQVHSIPTDRGPLEVRWRDLRIRRLD